MPPRRAPQSWIPGRPKRPTSSWLGTRMAPTAVIQATMDAGITDDYGITVTVQPSENQAAMLVQLISGEIPTGTINGFVSVLAVVQGADLRIVGEVMRAVENAQTLEVLPDSGIDASFAQPKRGDLLTR